MAACWGQFPAALGTLPPFSKGSVKMLTWFSVNLINIALIAVIAAITGLVIRSIVRDRRAGKSSCGGKCADCGGCSACGKKTQDSL